MKADKINNNQGFYKDIDRQSRKRSCCTCQTMLIGFIILFLAGVVGVWWLFKAFTNPDITPLRKIVPSQPALESYQKKIVQATAEALKGEAGSQNVTLVITEEELTSFLASQQDQLKTAQLAIKGINVAITPQYIEACGQLVKPLKAKLKIILLPSVKDGHLAVDIKSVKAGKVKLPKFVVGELNSLLEQLIQQSIKNGSITYLTNLELRNKELAITGRMR